MIVVGGDEDIGVPEERVGASENADDISQFYGPLCFHCAK